MNSSSLQGTILGKYNILHPIGRGGMAQVYKGYHQQLARFVAIKVLHTNLIEEPDFLARFHREAKSVAALHHPNIVQIYDIDVHNEIYYIVMELLEGGSLKSILSVYRNNLQLIPINFSIRILLDVLSGLGYAHNNGIIHRDIKSSNVLFNNRGQAILTDFGISHILGETHQTNSGAMMGTLSYMSPEQGLKNICDFRSDIYSTGIVAYEMLTGRIPFEADTPVAILLKHINEKIIPPREVNVYIPKEIESIVKISLKKKPEDRFQNTIEFIDAIKAAAILSQIDVPDFINLPTDLINKDLKGNSKQIFSGSSRNIIPDKPIYTTTTEPVISTSLSQYNSSRKEINVFQKIFQVPKNLKSEDIIKYSSKQTSLTAIFIIIVANICLLWVGGIYGWRIFIYSWPMELSAISLLLSFIMLSKASPWFLIPIGILLGNSLIFASSTLIGDWNLLIYTWPLEPFLIAGSIILPFYLAPKGLVGRWISQKLGLFLSMVSGFSIIIILLFSIIKIIF